MPKAVIPCLCAFCHTMFWRTPAVLRLHTGSGTYCSVECTRAADRLKYPQRFWEKVQRCLHEPWCLYCCWIWRSPYIRNGYACIKVHGKRCYAHRISWEIHNQRSLPSNTHMYVVQHLCHNKLCVNPWHLSFDSQRKNVAAQARVKLTKADVIRMRLLYEAGASLVALAREFNISNSHICQIVHHQEYRYIP